MTRTPRVAVVGAGVTGLSAAWHLRREAQRRGAALDVVLLERDDRPGGKIRSERVVHPLGDFVVEAGADSFLTQSKPWATELTMELGIGDHLIGTNDDARKVFVLNHGRLYPLPEGIFLIVPTRLGPFARSGLLSPTGKLRTGLDLVLPRRRDDGDETLAEFVNRRLGRQILDRIAEPLLSGIYNADAGRQSVLATLPRLRQLEKDHRSLILAALALRKKSAAAGRQASGDGRGAEPGDGRGPAGGGGAAAAPPRSMFVSFRGGMQELVDTLARQLRDELSLSTAVESIATQSGGGYLVTVAPAGGPDAVPAPDPPAGDAAATPATSNPTVPGPHRPFVADAVVLCTPAVESARLLAPLAPEAARRLATIRSVSTGTVSLAFEGDVLPAAARGFGLVIPTSERRPVNAVTCSSVKFDGRAPDGCTLLRVFFGGSRSPRTFALPDDEIVDVARRQLADLLDVRGTPLFTRLDRWPEAQPQYDVGHLDLIAEIESSLPPTLWVTGAACRGVGIPDCVRQGRDTAAEVAAALL